MNTTSVSPNDLAIRALVCAEDRVGVIVGVTGHGNEGLKLFVESSGTKSWYFRARVNGSPPNDMPLGRWPDVSIAEARQRKADAA